MKLWIGSDFHLEFHRDRGTEFLMNLDPLGCSVAVLAGDIDQLPHLGATLRTFAKKFEHVIYVPGNHEYYGKDAATEHAAIRRICNTIPNVCLLEAYEFGHVVGHIFRGGTLWFDNQYRPGDEGFISDFRLIRNFKPWVFESNAELARAMDIWLCSGEIVVTHHLPSYRSVPPVFAAEPTNAFFVHDMDKLILERKPRLWIHGHTHTDTDYMLGNTRVVARPMGYPGERGFRGGVWQPLVVDLSQSDQISLDRSL